MKLGYDEATQAFRAELQEWLGKNLPSPEERKAEPAGPASPRPAWACAWQRRLFDAGWLAPGWPPEYGGRNATPVQQLVYAEEMARIEISRTQDPQGLSVVAPSLLERGTPAQQELVRPTLRAEISWCLGMSEPGAGSDLASLSTRAEVRADRFVVTGQKIWTSGAHTADFCLCYVRTDPDAPRHRGISALIVDMKSPGISISPLADLIAPDRADFNQVFFDGVEVPRENLLGELGGGWSVASGSLTHERGMMWLLQYTSLERLLTRQLEERRREAADGGLSPEALDRAVQLYLDVQALRLMGYRSGSRDAESPAGASVLKLFASEVNQRAALAGAEALGAAALDVGPGPAGQRPWAHEYLSSFSATISGGTSEIQRNLIAQRGLSLPRR